MDREVDEDQVRPAALEALDGCQPAVGGAVVDDPEDAARGGVGLLGHHLADEPVEGGDAAPWLRAAEHPGTPAPPPADVKRSQIGERALALVAVFDPEPARAGGGWERLVDPPPRLDRRLLVRADHEVAGVEELALPASLVEIEHRAGPLEEVGGGREDPRAVLPGLERVLPQPAGDRRGRRLGDAALDHQPVQLSAGEARERDALLARQLAGDRLHLSDLFRGENDAGDPFASHPRAPRAAARRSVFASGRPPPCSSPAAHRSRRSSYPRPPTARASPSAPPGKDGCSRGHGARARFAHPDPAPPRKGCVPASPHQFAAPATPPSSATGLTAGST